MSTGFDYTLIVEVILAALLVATIVYAAVLDRKLGALRKSKTEMEGLIKDFAESTLKAEQGLAELKAHAGTSGNSLQQQVDDANQVLTDLKFLVERGETLSNQLESASATARDGLPDGGGRPAGGARNSRPDPRAQASAAIREAGEGDEPDIPISERLNLSSGNPGAQALLKALQRMR